MTRLLSVFWEFIQSSPVVWSLLTTIVIYLIERKFPWLIDYISPFAMALVELDRLIDYLLEEYPEIEHLQTIDDIVTEVITLLPDKYVKNLDEDTIRQHIEDHVTEKEGFSIDFEPDRKTVQYNKKF